MLADCGPFGGGSLLGSGGSVGRCARRLVIGGYSGRVPVCGVTAASVVGVWRLCARRMSHLVVGELQVGIWSPWRGS
jgi:hypothetical protein